MRYQALLISLSLASALAAVQPIKRQEAAVSSGVSALSFNSAGLGVFIKESGSTSAEAPAATASALSVSSGGAGGPLQALPLKQQTEILAASSGEGSSSSGSDSSSGSASSSDSSASSKSSASPDSSSNSGSSSDSSSSYGSDSSSDESSSGGGGLDDASIFNFAFTLERLETKFYQDAAATLNLNQWKKLGISGSAAQLISDTLSAIAQDEATHVSTIATTLAAAGASANTKCNFDFGAAIQDPFTFLAVARALEYVGTSAYLGAAPAVSDKSLLAAAATITTVRSFAFRMPVQPSQVEARHSSLLNVFSNGDAIPQAFDLGLTPPEVLALVGGFLKDCVASDLGLTTTPPLLVASSQDGSSIINVGTQLAFASLAQIDPDNHFCQLLIGGNTQAQVQPVSQCAVSANIASSGQQTSGPVYAWITSDSTPISADTTVRDLSKLVAGPALFFLDNSKRSQVLTAPLNIQVLGSANLGFSQFGSQIAFGNGKGLQVPGFLSQSDIAYTTDDGSSKQYGLSAQAATSKAKSTKAARGRRHARQRLTETH